MRSEEQKDPETPATGSAPLDESRDGRASWTLAEWDRMWRPSTWLRKPPRPHQTHWWHVAAIVALISYANIVANEILDTNWHVLFNLGILGVAIAIARHAEATWTDLGMRTDRIVRGLVVGAIVMAVIGVGIAIGVAIPGTRELFYDERVIDSTTPEVLVQALFRIPIVTAFYEEALFRGVLFGMFARRWPPLWAAVAASFIFGLWHVLPTLDTLETSPAGDMFSGLLGVVVAALGAVGGTMLAGFGFLWLRLRANSVVAPTLAHIATNSFALLAALLVVRFL